MYDGFNLEFKPRLIFGDAFAALFGIGIQLGQTLHQPFMSALAQKIVERLALGRGKQRQTAFPKLDRQVAAPRDFIGVGQRLRNVGKQLDHLGLRLEILVGAEVAWSSLVGQHLSFGNTDPRLVRGKFFGL